MRADPQLVLWVIVLLAYGCPVQAIVKAFGLDERTVCDFHHSLRLKLSVGSFGYRWMQRTPAIVARLTDHPWTPIELFNF